MIVDDLSISRHGVDLYGLEYYGVTTTKDHV